MTEAIIDLVVERGIEPKLLFLRDDMVSKEQMYDTLHQEYVRIQDLERTREDT